ncbi:MAG: hypothetical protein PHH21_03410 [Candidatus Pacebacteria bacterium]|nr:hypothetical protein [Candidatus Paceibacterota bacterium]
MEKRNNMEIVYYSNNNDGCPVKEYFNRLKGRVRLLVDIDSKLRHTKENKNSHLLSALHGYNFFEIKQRKNKNTVIRILVYFYKDKFALLNVFEKPDNYKETRIKKDIDKNYSKTKEYLEKFLLNPSNYEKYD